MESLRDSLCAQADNIATPAWHGDVIAHREQALNDGLDGFEDWRSAKRHIMIESASGQA